MVFRGTVGCFFHIPPKMDEDDIDQIYCVWQVLSSPRIQSTWPAIRPYLMRHSPRTIYPETATRPHCSSLAPLNLPNLVYIYTFFTSLPVLNQTDSDKNGAYHDDTNLVTKAPKNQNYVKPANFAPVFTHYFSVWATCLFSYYVPLPARQSSANCLHLANPGVWFRQHCHRDATHSCGYLTTSVFPSKESLGHQVCCAFHGFPPSLNFLFSWTALKPLLSQQIPFKFLFCFDVKKALSSSCQ